MDLLLSALTCMLTRKRNGGVVMSNTYHLTKHRAERCTICVSHVSVNLSRYCCMGIDMYKDILPTSHHPNSILTSANSTLLETHIGGRQNITIEASVWPSRYPGVLRLALARSLPGPSQWHYVSRRRGLPLDYTGRYLSQVSA